MCPNPWTWHYRPIDREVNSWNSQYYFMSRSPRPLIPHQKKEEEKSFCLPSFVSSLTHIPLVSLLFSLFLSNPSPHALLHWLSPSQQQSRNWKTEGRASGWQVVRRGSIKKKTENTQKMNQVKTKRQNDCSRSEKGARQSGWMREGGCVTTPIRYDRERERGGGDRGRGGRIDRFRRQKAIKRQRSIKSGVLGRTRVQWWFKLNLCVCVAVLFMFLWQLGLCRCAFLSVCTSKSVRACIWCVHTCESVCLFIFVACAWVCLLMSQ